jgi:hypothetical protein
MKRVAWTIIMIGVATLASAAPRLAVAQGGECGSHCVTDLFCPIDCTHCRDFTPFEKTCQVQ